MEWDLFGLCRGPLNEDVFAAPNYTEDRILHPSVQEITEQIYRLLLQVQHVLSYHYFKFPLKKGCLSSCDVLFNYLPLFHCFGISGYSPGNYLHLIAKHDSLKCVKASVGI